MLCDPGTPCVRFRTVTEHELDSTTAQFVLLTSMQKLDQAKRSRGGIRLRRGLLIAVTALKARQLLWELDNHPYEGYITPSEDISLSTFSKPAVTETEGCLASTCALTTGPVEDVQCTSPVWPIQDRIQTPNAPNSTTDTVFDSESSSSPFSTLPNLEYVFPPISHLYFASSDADITEAHG
ncbi:zinc finger protein, partial [Clonorchis sinensis]